MSDKILLIPPGHNRTPRAVVKTAPGMIALDMTCVSPAVRWFTVESLAAVNDRAAVAQACKAPELEPVQGCELPPPLHIYPMPAVYPQAVFLAAANYYLHSQVLYLDPVGVEKSAAMIAKAG